MVAEKYAKFPRRTACGKLGPSENLRTGNNRDGNPLILSRRHGSLQDRFDGRRVADALAAHRRRYDFWDDDRKMIEQASFFFIATSFGEHVDCSMRSGAPGFIHITGPGTLEFPEYDGNSMYRTLGNISRNPNVGLLFVKFDGQSYRIRINGNATILDDPKTLARHHAAKLVVRVQCELFSNCPRAVHDIPNDRLSVHVPSPGRAPPAPEWKSRDYIKDILPANDPHVVANDEFPIS